MNVLEHKSLVYSVFIWLPDVYLQVFWVHNEQDFAMDRKNHEN